MTMRKRTPEGMPLKDRLEFQMMPVTESGCWIWMALSKRHGYGEIKVNGKMQKAHRMSWEVYRGKIPEGMSVLHRCDITSCINPDHLFLGTQYDNVRDMHKKGRARKRGCRGETNPMAKLTAKEIIEIRSSKETELKLAAKYKISRAHVGSIKRRMTWSHIQ